MISHTTRSATSAVVSSEPTFTEHTSTTSAPTSETPATTVREAHKRSTLVIPPGSGVPVPGAKAGALRSVHDSHAHTGLCDHEPSRPGMAGTAVQHKTVLPRLHSRYPNTKRNPQRVTSEVKVAHEVIGRRVGRMTQHWRAESDPRRTLGSAGSRSWKP